jgi:putative membrane protein (TIGR04086 family)
MSGKVHIGNSYRIGRAFIISVIMFTILMVAIGLLLRFTSLPERWTYLYILGALCFACFIMGLLSGHALGKNGILFGAVFSILLLLIIIVVTVLITGTYSVNGLMRPSFIPCIISGSLGGMVGVNIK